ncbi:MAG: hypothetical protein QM784_09605 [Polyangiaceae bacterium]
MATYNITNQWGGSSAPWYTGGVFVLGARDDKPQNVVAVSIRSKDGGKTLTGTVTYSGEGPIGFRATLLGNNNYDVQNQWGGAAAPWHPGGTWIIGSRDGQNVVALDVNSSDDGQTLAGAMTYSGEGEIGIRGQFVGQNCDFRTENQWGGSEAEWHRGGIFVLGARAKQNVVSVNVKSADGGQTLTGTITYSGEGEIGFRGKLSGASTYRVENQWGGVAAPWHPGGEWLIGYRAGKQNVVALNASSTDNGKTLNGSMIYDGEGPIGFRARQA